MVTIYWWQLIWFILFGYFFRGITDALFKTIDESRAKRRAKRSALRAEKIAKRNAWRRVDFHVGDVVQTKEGFDRGLVTSVDEHNRPVKVLSSPGSANYTEPRYYGGDHSVEWYKTGEHMTKKEWYELYSLRGGWERYCEDRSNQTNFGA